MNFKSYRENSKTIEEHLVYAEERGVILVAKVGAQNCLLIRDANYPNRVGAYSYNGENISETCTNNGFRGWTLVGEIDLQPELSQL